MSTMQAAVPVFLALAAIALVGSLLYRILPGVDIDRLRRDLNLLVLTVLLPALNFNVIYGALTGEPCDAEAAAETLREIPLDLVHWNVQNSHRPDVLRHPDRGRFNEEQSLLPLPFGERPIMNWNGNPYRLDGGDGGRTEEDGTFFLLPYWMGRYFGIFAEGSG